MSELSMSEKLDELRNARLGYSYGEYRLRREMVDALQQYANSGVELGGFLMAALENDLSETMSRADDDNRRNLPALVTYMYNELPALCWGSKEKVRDWMDRKAKESGK